MLTSSSEKAVQLTNISGAQNVQLRKKCYCKIRSQKTAARSKILWAGPWPLSFSRNGS